MINKKYEKAPYNYDDGIYQFDKVEKLAKAELGAKYLVFASSDSVKMRELSFAQFLYFLRKVCLFFNFWMINSQLCQTIHNCESYHSNIEK